MNSVMKSLRDKYKDKNLLVVGLGLLGGGVGVAKFFAKLGAKVTVTDLKNSRQLASSIKELKGLPITFHLGKHDPGDFIDADVIFKGPFVPWDLSGIVEAEKQGIPIEMELSFFAEYCPAKIIGITGTRGKSTTTYMIYKLLKALRFPVFLGGGLPGISTISLLPKLTNRDWVVMELPSWPLAGFHQKHISPNIAVFTNFYPDHLNFYKDIDKYLLDKKAVYLYQNIKDYLIAGKQLQGIIQKDHPKSHTIYFQAADFPYEFNYLHGDHNKENAAASLSVAKALKLNMYRSIDILKQFKGLAFRQEIIGKKDNIVFVNDSTSTTPIATIKAIEAFQHGRIILILGGNSKQLPHSKLLFHLKSVDKIVILAGTFTDEIMSKLKRMYPEKITKKYDNLSTAVKKAYQLAIKNPKKKTYILFSPGATSFAMFNNEFHRGEEFNKYVSSIICS